MRRWVLSKRDKRWIVNELRKIYKNLPFGEENTIEYAIIDDTEFLIVDRVPAMVKINEKYIPLISYLLKQGVDWLPRIVVDQGAVAPLARGADLMRPGIVEVIGEFNVDEIVVILEPSRRIPIAVHRALIPSSELSKIEKGRITKRLHYVGDRYWKLAEKLLM